MAKPAIIITKNMCYDNFAKQNKGEIDQDV